MKIIRHIALSLVLMLLAVTLYAQFGGGDGTDTSPYQITSVDHLVELATNVNLGTPYSGVYFNLLFSLNLDIPPYNTGEGWIPIGDSEYNPFEGIFDGLSYTITGLYIDRPWDDLQGLFGYTSNAQIQNLSIENAHVVGASDVGMAVACASGSEISYVYAQGYVYGTERVGGLVGFAYNTTIEASYTRGTVTGTKQVGGLVGNHSNSSIISSCYSSCEVEGRGTVFETSVGGLVGRNYFSEINDSYSTGRAFGHQYIGGLVGYNYFGTIANCYSTALAIANQEQVGGLVGYSASSTATSSYWDINMSGHIVSAGGEGRMIAQMKQQITYGGWDFASTWAIEPGSHPFHLWQGEAREHNLFNFNTLFQSGSGTELDPWIVSTPEQLSNMRYCEGVGNADVYFELANDIDLGIPPYNTGKGWQPIGQESYRDFYCKLNGAGHIIKNLYINRPTEIHVGLFGMVRSTEVSNLGIESADVTGDKWVGTLTGRTRREATITNCYSTGTVIGVREAGGLVGFNEWSSILSSYSSASVTSELSLAGGLVGDHNFYASIENCYSTGSVSGSASGGLVGRNYLESVIHNSYSVGAVNNPTGNGGLVNESFIDSEVFTSFWDTERSGQPLSDGGGDGLTTLQMQDIANFTAAGWDFVGETINGVDDIWDISSSFNSGYPFLSWQDTPSTPSLTTYATSNITGTAALLSGVITGFGASTIQEHGFCWNTTGSPTITDPNVALGIRNDFETFTHALTGLDENSTYYVCAYATNSEGTSYGNQIKFTTHPIEAIEPSGSPYLIESLANLYWITTNPNSWGAEFIQVANIDASSTSAWFNGEGWQPIGISPNNFTGSYNGQGYTINGLHINRTETDELGLFGSIEGATIQNLGLTNISIAGKDFVGGLAGYISQVSTVINCFTTGTINGSDYVGGIVGSAYDSEIQSSFSICSISARYFSGGFAGDIGTSRISNCYAKGGISGAGYLGGLIGSAYSSEVEYSYSTGAPSTPSEFGGLVGDYYSSTATSCFWDGETSGNMSGDFGEAKFTLEMKSESTFTSEGWDFINIWRMDGTTNDGYPFFTWQEAIELEPTIETTNVSSIRDTVATIHTTISNIDSGTDITAHGVVWGTNPNPTIDVDEFTDLGAISTPYTFTTEISVLIPATTYYVKSYFATPDTTVYSNERSFTTLSLPLAPEAFAATEVAATRFTANWGTISNAIGYKLYVSTDGFSTFVEGFNGLEVSGLLYTITGLSPETEYQYRVIAYNIIGDSDPSITITVETDVLAAPGTSTALSATSVTTTSFTANWSEVIDTDGYRLYVSTDSFSTFVDGYNGIEVTELSQLVSGLSPATQYQYRVVAYNAVGSSEFSNTIAVETLALSLPNAPTALAATSITTSSFTANWEEVSDADGYRLYVSTDSFSTFVDGYNGLEVTGLSQLVSNLSPATEYQFRMVAYNDAGDSDPSNTITIQTAALTPPEAPTALAATAISTTSFTANWSEVSNTDGYRLYVSADTFATHIEGFNGLEVTGLSHLIAGLSPDTEYQYQLVAFNNDGESGISNSITVTTLAPTAPNSPSALDATNITATSFVANWAALADATGYMLYVSTDGFATHLIDYFSLVATGTSQLVEGLTPNSNYSYRLRAFNGNGESTYSNTIHVTTLTTSSKGLAPNASAPYIYPNPASSTIKVQGNVDIQGVEVYSISGALCARGGIKATGRDISLDISHLAPGVYTVRILTNEGIYTNRLIVNR